jgi:hypothetical protein
LNPQLQHVTRCEFGKQGAAGQIHQSTSVFGGDLGHVVEKKNNISGFSPHLRQDPFSAKFKAMNLFPFSKSVVINLSNSL